MVTTFVYLGLSDIVYAINWMDGFLDQVLRNPDPDDSVIPEVENIICTHDLHKGVVIAMIYANVCTETQQISLEDLRQEYSK